MVIGVGRGRGECRGEGRGGVGGGGSRGGGGGYYDGSLAIIIYVKPSKTGVTVSI